MKILYEMEFATIEKMPIANVTYTKNHIVAIGKDKKHMTWVLYYEGRNMNTNGGYVRVPYTRDTYKAYYKKFKEGRAPVAALMDLQERIIVEEI